MAGRPNSCRTWQHILHGKQPKICLRSCFEPRNGPCAEPRPRKTEKPGTREPSVVQVRQKSVIRNEPSAIQNREPSVVQNLIEPELPVRRFIDIETECSKCLNYGKIPDKFCTLHELSGKHHPHNLCSSKCRPLSTNLHTQQYNQRAPDKPDSKLSYAFEDGTMVGRVFPMKFRIRRQLSECSNCDKDLKLKETVTDANNLVLLSSCCNVEVYPEYKMDNWHSVPVSLISGNQKFSKKVVSEVCAERKKIPSPPPTKAVTIAEEVIKDKPKKKKKKKKGAKGKKGKKGKK